MQIYSKCLKEQTTLMRIKGFMVNKHRLEYIFTYLTLCSVALVSCHVMFVRVITVASSCIVLVSPLSTLPG